MDGSASPRKSQRGDREQILHVGQLAGGVALEGQQRIVAEHAGAVVGQADQPPPAGFDVDAKLARPGVQRVFEQLLDDAGRPFHDLSGRDFVRDGVGKNTDAAHGKVSSLLYGVTRE